MGVHPVKRSRLAPQRNLTVCIENRPGVSRNTVIRRFLMLRDHVAADNWVVGSHWGMKMRTSIKTLWTEQ